MCKETYSTITQIIRCSLLILVGVLLAGPIYTDMIYRDLDTYIKCNIGNALALATYLAIGGLIMCMSGFCYVCYSNFNKLYKTRYFSTVDAVLTLCCLAMGAGFAGGIYSEFYYTRCLIGNIMSWVTLIFITLCVVIKNYYNSRPLLSTGDSPTYTSV
jgi:hypothetical protein